MTTEFNENFRMSHVGEESLEDFFNYVIQLDSFRDHGKGCFLLINLDNKQMQMNDLNQWYRYPNLVVHSAGLHTSILFFQPSLLLYPDVHQEL